MMLYVEDRDGKPVDGKKAAEIRRFSRALFAQFANNNTAPKTWMKADMATSENFAYEMCKRVPELRLCEGRWKVTQIATDVYPSWHTHYFKNSGSVTKREDTDIDMGNSSTGSKHPQDMQQSLHATKKTKGAEFDIDNNTFDDDHQILIDIEATVLKDKGTTPFKVCSINPNTLC